MNGFPNGTGSGDGVTPDPSLAATLRQTYTNAGQEHVFAFYDKLAPAEQTAFLRQLASIDVNRVNRIYKNAVAADPAITPPLEEPSDSLGLGARLIGRSRTPSPQPEEVNPLPDDACATIVNHPEDEARWRDIGLKAIAENQVAVLLLAGGQGTRLGSPNPKGMYDISLPSGMTLFDYQAGRIQRLQKVAEAAAGKPAGSVRIVWFVMTSGPTRETTEDYFESRAYFGLDRADVIFFEQGVLPALSEDGKLLLSSPSSVAVAPDGNGGLYAALRRPTSATSSQTVMDHLKQRGIRYIHGYCVDNCLVKVADPVFIGCCVEREAPLGSKVVRKTDPSESVGVLGQRGDRFSVIEYSELPRSKAEIRTADGQLAFRAANIVNHFYTYDFLDGVEAMERKMAFHIARKKIPTIDLITGEPVNPKTPNGMKLEMFVFDVFPFCKTLCVLEVTRPEEFSPLKNAPGSKTDSPETSRRDLLAQHKRWLQVAGAELAWGVEVETTPEVTYGGEGLEFVQGKKFVRSGAIRSPQDVDKLV